MNREEKRKYDREYHAKRSPEKKLHKQKMQDERAHRNLLTIREYKAVRGCADCGEKDPIVLDFDHSDRALKSFNMGECTRRGFSLNTLLKEAEKCEVVCANCHRKRTAKQLNWRQ